MANVGDERLSGEEGSTLEELRSKLARMNLPISGARSVLIARLNRACRAGQSYPKGATGGEEPTGQRDLENVQKAERDCNEDENVEKMNTKELKERLASLGLKTTGRKAELRVRLQAAKDGNDVSSEEESDDESEDEDDKKYAGRHKRGTRRVYQDRDECCRRACVGATLSFRDVEDALESFSGNKGENVERWFESFEEVADTCMWSDGQKTVYARKLLKGSAKIFASFECHARTWPELKRGLVKEFSRKVNSRQVHQKLEETKKESDEACLAYMYRMLEIASHVDIEEEAKVEYIVDGIIDNESNKAILYGATSIKELRKRLVMYEEQKSRRAKSIVKPAKTENKGKPSRSAEVMKKRRCFVCGSEDHLSVKCPERGKGVRCFECGGSGHVAARCTARPKETCVVSRSEKRKYMKEVVIDDCRFVALVDTGSDLTFIRSDEYARLGSPPLGKCRLKFDGFSSAGNETWGEFTKVMMVDGYKLPITLHVVSNKILTKHGMLLGTDFLDQVELRVKRGEVTFLRLDEQTNKDVPNIFRINAIEQTDEIDLTHVQEPHYREAIRDIIKGYKLEKRVKDQEEELDDLAGQVQLLEQAKLRLEMSIEQQRKEIRKEMQQRDEELEDVRGNALKKVKALESQLENEHEERTILLREKHELERRLVAIEEQDRAERAAEADTMHRLKRDLKRTKALLRDAQTMLERSKGDSTGKAALRQLKNQLEDAECARAVAVKAKQALEQELNETQASLEEALRQRSEAEDRANVASRERTELLSQLEENEEELAEVLKKYRAAVQQVSAEQGQLQEAQVQIAALEAEKSALKDQLSELTQRLESVEQLGDPTANSLATRRLEFRAKELESKLELEQTTRARLETQIARLKENVEKLQTETALLRTKEQSAQDASRRLQRSLRETREEASSALAREQESTRARRELEKSLEAAEAETKVARDDLRLALQRIDDLQSAIQGELDLDCSEEGTTENSDSD